VSANNSWQALLENRFSRNFGGTKQGVADPYISGYFWAYWTDLPPALTKYIPYNLQTIATVLTASCEAVTTLPEYTLNKASITALAGLKYNVPSNVDIGDSITTRHREFSGTPIFHIIRGWCTMIRDYRTGVAKIEGDEYTKSNYACTIFYWTTKPDGKTIEFCMCCTGCFPTRPNEGNFAHDVGTNDTIAPEIEWNCDIAYCNEDWVLNKCNTLSQIIFKDTSILYSRREGV